MEAVLGSWKIIAGSEKGYEGFFKAMGITDEMASEYRKREVIMTFSKEGEKLKMTELINNDPNKKSMSYVYAMGEELDTVDIDGAPLKMEMNWDGSKFQEVYTYKDHDSINVVREVSNGKMKVTMDLKGNIASDEWEKC